MIKMIKRRISLLLFILLVLSLITIVIAENPGTCKNPNGGNYCDRKSQVSECYCDKYCTKIGDCCTDYQQVCLNSNPQQCTDTDNGKNYYVKGSTTAQEVSRTDFCYSSAQLHEYYCDPSAQVAFILTTCPTTCSSGACLNQATKNDVTDYVSKCTSTSTAANKDQVLNYVNDKCSDTATQKTCPTPPMCPNPPQCNPPQGCHYENGDSCSCGKLVCGTTPAKPETNKRVKALQDLKIRSDASTSATVLGTVPATSFGTVRCDLATQPCPKNVDGYTWWYIDWDDTILTLPTGWSVQGTESEKYLSFADYPSVIGADGPLRVSTVGGWEMLGIVPGGNEYPILVLGNSGTTVSLSTPNLQYGLSSVFSKGFDENGVIVEGNTCTSPCVASFALFSDKNNCPFGGQTCGVQVAASIGAIEMATSPFHDLHTANEMRKCPTCEAFTPTMPDQIFHGPITTPLRIVAIKVQVANGGTNPDGFIKVHIDGLGFEQGKIEMTHSGGFISSHGDNVVTITDPNGNVLDTQNLAAVTPTAATDFLGYNPDMTNPGYNYLVSAHFNPLEDTRSKNTIFPTDTLVIIMPIYAKSFLTPGNKITVSNIRGSHTVVYGANVQFPPSPPTNPTFGPQPTNNAFRIIGETCYDQNKLCPGYKSSADFATGGSYTVIVGETGMKPGVVFDVYSNNKATVLGTLTPFYTDGIGEFYCASSSNTGGGRCTAAFVLPVPPEWTPNTYWVRARNTDGTVSNFVPIVVTSSNQLPASLDSPNSNWVDGATILNNLASFTATQGKTYKIDVYGWNFKDGAKIVLCPHGRSSTLSSPGLPVLPGTCSTQIEIPTTKVGLGHLQSTYTIPNDLNLGGYIAFVKNPGGELGLGGNLINVFYADQNVPDDPKISVSPISGPVGTTFIFKSDCSFKMPDHLTIVGKVNSGSLIVPAKPASPQGSVCGVSLTMSSTLQGQKDLPLPDDAVASATISPGFYEVRPSMYTGGNHWGALDMRIWAVEIK